MKKQSQRNNKVIRKISSIQIDSIIYENNKDTNTGKINNKLFINTSFAAASYDNLLSKKNLRIFVSTDPDTIKVLDYVSQRYNEYLNINPDNLTTYEFNNSLQRTLELNKKVMKSSRPFFPTSTDIESRNLLITNNVSKMGDGSVITKGVMIYDVSLEQVATMHGAGTYILDPVSLTLPETEDSLKNLSVYAFIYDLRVPTLGAKNAQENFSLTTGATGITRSTPLGVRTLYKPLTKDNLLLGMTESDTLFQPDQSSLRTLSTSPDDSVIQRFTNITDKVSHVFTNASLSKNYQLKKILKNQNYFSDMWLSRDHDNTHKFVFAFDLRSYLIDNAIFPFVFTNDRLANAAIQGTDILSASQRSRVMSVETYRRYIEPSSFITENSMTTVRSKNKTQNLTYPEVPTTNVERVDIGIPNIFPGSQIEFFEVYDNLGAGEYDGVSVKGQFAYSAACEVYDNSPLMVRRMVSVLYSYKDTLRVIKDLMSYRATRSEPTTSSTTFQIDGSLATIQTRVMAIVTDYQDILNAINSDLPTSELVKYYDEVLRAGNTELKANTIDELDQIINLGIHFMFQQLERIFPNDPLGRHEDKSVASLQDNFSKAVQKPISRAYRAFPGSYNVGTYNDFGLDYIFSSDASPNMRTLSLEDYTSRRQDEFKKYFAIPSEEDNPDPAGTYKDPSYAYMSPKIISTPNREQINQLDTKVHGTAVSYNYNRYAQLFSDIVEVKERADGLGETSPWLSSRNSGQKISNKTYSTVLSTLNSKFSLFISEDPEQQFSPPKVDKGKPKTTFYNPGENKGCGVGNSAGLISSIIGGKDTTSASTQNYFKGADKELENSENSKLSGSLDNDSATENEKDRSIKLPFVIFGELSVGGLLSNARHTIEPVYNSLTELRNILKITSANVVEAVQSESLNSMPNQVKNMIIISSTGETSTLSSGDGTTQYEACRPVVTDGIKDKEESSLLVSVFDNRQKTPPYPLVEDPMKSYAKFLTFWMNYRQIGVVEYLDNFESLRITPNVSQYVNNKLKLDKWSTLTPDIIDLITGANRSILCRVRQMEAGDYLDLIGTDLSQAEKDSLARFFEVKEELSLPTYNKYFYIK